jgi:HEAT repeats
MRLPSALLFAVLLASSLDAFPPLGIIDFYGLRTVSEAQVLQVLPYHLGDTIDIDQFKSRKHAVEQKLASIPGVVEAHLTLVCCNLAGDDASERKSILYVGIEENGSLCPKFLPGPTGSVRLTADVLTAGDDYEVAFQKAILSGNFVEDDSQGYALDNNPDVRAIQLQFLQFAHVHLANLKDVLHNSSDSHQRAIAAQVLGYVKDKQSIVPELVAAMRDPDADVRNNASRALLVFAEFSPKPPASTINVPPQPFVRLLSSCIWSDRNKSAGALAELSEKRDPALLAELRKQALPALIEMANWKSSGHALSSLRILGRIGGLSDDAIQKRLAQGDRASIIAAAKEATNH